MSVMVHIEDYEHITGEWIDAQLITLLICEQVRSIQPTNPIFDKTEPVTLRLIVNPPSEDYDYFALNVSAYIPVSNDEKYEDLSIGVIGDFVYAPSEDIEDTTSLQIGKIYTVLYDDDDNPLMVKDIRRKRLGKEECYMKVLQDFYATGRNIEDIKKLGIIV